ncbi:Protein FAR1-RELATED SEQUENCE 6 [Rhynchospora pubera]|uniref:Protein FAR1-RELATED SEQUENCE n=1 Tax=Rhynchospora pubera TaxID=906938 RepID=A0AAV8HVU4_9POAL|nr:Protein FAR1-RELATED SEQUENCE 6 [Rhynchospora pubera]
MEGLHYNTMASVPFQDQNSSLSKTPKDKPLVINDAVSVPKQGMHFDSPEEAYEFYLSYGYRTGFGVSKRSCHTVDGIKYRATFVCYKGGKPRIKPGLKARRRLVAKTDCKAMMVVKYNSLQSNWEVVFLELEHNHPCNPEMVRFMMCFKELPDWQKEHQPFNAKTRLNPKIHSGRGRPPKPKEFVERSFAQRNFGNEMGKLRFVEGDVEALLVFFDRMQAQDPSFFYSWDMDDEGRLKNVCWVDARSRASYKYFGDVVSFDTVYLTDRYVMPLVAFLGMNHHGQFVLLGCGLLGDETVESYAWLFKKWLKCMDDRPPDAIITSHTSAVTQAAAMVFPTARRRYNLWHVMKELPDMSGRPEDKETVSLRFKKVVYDTLTTADFEREWADMVKQYNLYDNHWMTALFEERDKWVPAFIKDTFWAGISTVRRSERLEAFFDGYITPETTIKTFIEQYDTAMKLRIDREAYDDFRSFQQSPQVLSGLTFEDQIAKLYTINMFQKFQDQVRQLMHVNCKEVSRTGSMVTYSVTVLGKDRRVDYRVVFNSSEKDVWCVCRSFQFKGILCSHVLAVLRQELVMYIPNKYVMNRWKKNYRQLHEDENTDMIASPLAEPAEPAVASPIEEPSQVEQVGPTNQALENKNYDHLYKHGHQYFADIVELGAMDQDAMEYALSVMKEAREKILKKFEESRGGGGTSTSAVSESADKGKGKHKHKEKEKDKDKGRGNKGKRGRNADNSTAVPGPGMVPALSPMLAPPMAPPPPGMIYMPVHPHPLVFPSFPGAVPPIPPIPTAPDVSNATPETEKPKKRRRRRGS